MTNFWPPSAAGLVAGVRQLILLEQSPGFRYYWGADRSSRYSANNNNSKLLGAKQVIPDTAFMHFDPARGRLHCIPAQYRAEA
jgi:hypothetical protein